MKIIQTGNYIFKVFKDNDPEKTVFTKRFQVYENQIITRAKANRPSKVQERNYKQEIDFEQISTIIDFGTEEETDYKWVKIIQDLINQSKHEKLKLLYIIFFQRFLFLNTVTIS